MSRSRGKKYLTKVDQLAGHEEGMDIRAALEALKGSEATAFDESFEMAINLGVNAKNSDQQVRGSVVLPHGTGKAIRVLVFAQGEAAKKATDAGADYVGDEDLIDKIKSGWLEFDKVIATPDMMSKVSKVARVLGPKGLMPNPKLGTVTPDVDRAIENQKKGVVEYRTDKGGVIHALIGKRSFETDHLVSNYEALVGAVIRSKPATVKGEYVRDIYVSTTMSPSVSVKR